MSSSPALEPSSPSTTTPSSPALRAPEFPVFQTSTPNYIKKQNPPLNVILPSSASTTLAFGEPTLTPPPRSPGAAASPATPASGDRNQPLDGTSSDKSSETAVGVSRTPSTALSRKESYKAQRQHYRREKKRVASALLHSIEDPSVVVLADWLKVRGSLKSWTKLWCVLKPGLLLLYKSCKAKSSHWVGTVLLTSCQVIERPSKKDGFCFKLYHPLEQSIWAPRGPHNETIGAVVQPLPTAHLIFRAPSSAAGHCWLDGMELALRCSNAMLRCSRSRPEQTVEADTPATETNISHEELEKHFTEHVVKPSEAFSSTSTTPLMSVLDYSTKHERKKVRKTSKWAQFMESIELMSKDHDTESEKDGRFQFMKMDRLSLVGRHSPSATSAKVIVEPRTQNRLSKSLASSPMRMEKRPMLKCFDMPKLSIIDRRDKVISPMEDNLMKLMMTLPKRRSSTPSTKLTQKRISDLRKSGAKTDSEDDVFGKKSQVLCDTPDNTNIIITKTSPSVERFLRYSSSSTDDVCDFGRKSPFAESFTPQKYSLIDYCKLPSASYESCKTERRDERFSSQNVYVAGKIVCNDELAGAASDTDSEGSRPGMTEGSLDARRRPDAVPRPDSCYVEDMDRETGAAGELVEEVAEENKSLLWFLLKQVRPGMDLSKVVLPTFILEPRSFLDKLSDNYYHADILAQAKNVEDSYLRFKLVLRWYLSGLYRKPKGLKKPYNPVLGEVFRCCWKHPDSHTSTYYIAEQVSHHPPVSAFYISNRKEGFVIEGSLLARSKFYGNSTSAILEGCARVNLLPWKETYVTTAPYAHCKGIVIGTLSMELGGKIHIMCAETGYSADVDFKLRSFLGGADQTNAISGRIRKGKDTIAYLEGYWDGKIEIKDKRSGTESNLLDVAVLKEQRLRRYLMAVERQTPFESQRLWTKVSEAIANDDQIAATEHKTEIEEAQRMRAKGLQGPWKPILFHQEPTNPPEGIIDQGWKYNHSNFSAWQPTEAVEFEEEFVIKSQIGSSAARVSDTRLLGSDTDSRGELASRSKTNTRTLKQTLYSLDTSLREQSLTLERLTAAVENLNAAQGRYQPVARVPTTSHNWDVFGGFIIAMVMQGLFNWIFYRRD